MNHPDPRVGELLQRKYRLDAVLGVGGMATVYAATHRNGRRFAIKILHPPIASDPVVCERFQREGYVANLVGHAGAVAVIDDDVDELGCPFLVMELLEGEDLEHLTRRKGDRLDPFTVLAIVDKLLDVLVAAHHKGIVHRDIKPENVFLTHEQTIKVLDFGIARLADSATRSSRLTSTGTPMGSPAFMSPEQALARPERVDARSDLWSVGATMFYCMSGRLVHEGVNLNEQLVLCATQPPRSLRTVARNVHPAIIALVDRALEFDPARRWQCADDMQDQLREAYYVAQGAPMAPPETTSRVSAGPAARHVPASPQRSAPAASDSAPVDDDDDFDAQERTRVYQHQSLRMRAAAAALAEQLRSEGEEPPPAHDSVPIPVTVEDPVEEEADDRPPERRSPTMSGVSALSDIIDEVDRKAARPAPRRPSADDATTGMRRKPHGRK